MGSRNKIPVSLFFLVKYNHAGMSGQEFTFAALGIFRSPTNGWATAKVNSLPSILQSSSVVVFSCFTSLSTFNHSTHAQGDRGTGIFCASHCSRQPLPLSGRMSVPCTSGGCSSPRKQSGYPVGRLHQPPPVPLQISSHDRLHNAGWIP